MRAASGIWVLTRHAREGLDVRALEDLCEVNALVRKGGDGYEPIAWGRDMEALLEKRREMVRAARMDAESTENKGAA
jgi:hypothetical protein